jgi:spermidine synthase
LYAVLVVLASTGLAYELSLGAVESFLLGEPVSSFALIISGTMVALGLGSYLSSWIKTELELRFIDAAVATATVGGASAPMLYVVFGLHGPFRFVLYAATLLIGTLVGLQLPLLLRILKRNERFADVVARGFALDYAGGLAGSLAFSFVFMPSLGLIRTTLVLGCLNLVVAAYGIHLLGWKRKGMKLRGLTLVGVGALLMTLGWFAPHFEAMTERPL